MIKTGQETARFLLTGKIALHFVEEYGIFLVFTQKTKRKRRDLYG